MSKGALAYERGDCSAAVRDSWWPLAMRGDSRAQTYLGVAYAYGLTVNADLEGARFWLVKAASRGDPDAAFALGRMYEFGIGVNKDYGSALRWYSQAAKSGDGNAAYRLALLYFGAGHVQPANPSIKPDLKQGFTWLRRAATRGNAVAETYLGWRLAEGKDIPRDMEQGIYWLKKAVSAGAGVAAKELGDIYRLNTKPPNVDESFRWYLESTRLQNSFAPVLLAFYYELGLGTRRNAEAAAKSIHLAARFGSPLESSEDILKVFLDLESEARGTTDITHWVGLHALSHDNASLTMLGLMYEYGIGAPQDSSRAASYLQSASDNGYPPASVLLGDTLLVTDIDRATVLFQHAADLGDVVAENYLGQLYDGLFSKSPDGQKAILWLGKAAEGGDVSAEVYLGDLYNFGTLTPRNFKLASQWYEQAAKQGSVQGQFDFANLYLWNQPFDQSENNWVSTVRRDAGLTKSTDAENMSEWYEQAAQGGNPNAQVLWGMRLLCNGSMRDHNDGVRWLKLSANHDIYFRAPSLLALPSN